MRGTIVRIGVTGAGALVAVGFLAASPAAAKGPDRDGWSERAATAGCFTAEGKTQGRSHSDPDGMDNGGPDKPGCAGGFDSDRDGNNGCGNDADREDDNNGRCSGERDGKDGPSTASGSSTTTTSTTTTVGTAGLTDISAAGAVPAPGVLAEGASGGAAEDPTTVVASTDPVAAASAEPRTEVLGQSMERPSVLARTGAGVGTLTVLGGLLCAGGRLASLTRRFLRID